MDRSGAKPPHRGSWLTRRPAIRLLALGLALPFASSLCLAQFPEVELDQGGSARKPYHMSSHNSWSYTPVSNSFFLGRTEFGFSRDFVTSSEVGGANTTVYSVSATTHLYHSEKLDLGISPQAIFFDRAEPGARLGLTAAVRYNTGPYGLEGTVSWSTATHASEFNPAHSWGSGFGFSRQLWDIPFLGDLPLAGRLTPHVNAEWIKSVGQPNALLAVGGLEYEVTEHLSLDFTSQHYAAPGSAPDHQIAIGMSVNLSKQRKSTADPR